VRVNRKSLLDLINNPQDGGNNVFTKEEQDAIAKLNAFQETCSKLVAHFSKPQFNGPEDADAIILAAQVIIENISDPYKQGSKTCEESLMFRALKRKVKEEVFDVIESKKPCSSSSALRAAVATLFGAALVEPMWAGTSCAPGLCEFVV